MVGIHTPDPAPKKSLDNIKRAIAAAKLEFPIAIDPKYTMWQRYKYNSWPAIFLVDRQGRVRCWWKGELKTEQADGDRLLRERIEALLKEKG